MKVTKTVRHKITSHTNRLKATLNIYREALAFIVDAINNEWETLSLMETSKERYNHVEKLIHETKENPSPQYPKFDQQFHKFPSYFRRSATAEAMGIVSSHRSNLANHYEKQRLFESEGKAFKDKAPTLSKKHDAFPVFYKSNMFNKLGDGEAMIKVFHKNDWVWIKISFEMKNLEKRDLLNYKAFNPTLVKHGKKYYLAVPYQKNMPLKNTKLEDQTIISVDLGLTNSAVCSAMRSDGTVTDRIFINQSVEKDRLLHRLGRLKKAQKKSGQNSKNNFPNHWRKINHLQKQIVHDTASQMIKFAEKNGADVIVFEYLGKFKLPKGQSSWVMKFRQKMQYWAKSKIQDKVEDMAHKRGMRFRRVSAKNTSALAFDGSGLVKRNRRKDIALFQSGKTYQADLNASYNIGARYFIKEIQKTSSEKKWSQALAKVPELELRTRGTLSSLISLAKAM
ncbi:MAG: transposase [delta proteobacterium ML8_F1]|nr:MAG: transposase [delta proteobacterium ML8_F1]